MEPYKEEAKQGKEKSESALSEGFFGSYENFARTLRNWLIIYGIAVPAYFVKEKEFAEEILINNGFGHWILKCFLIGILLQLMEVFLYKISMGYLYLGELDSEFQAKKRYRLSAWYSNQTWPVAVMDIGTIFVYGWATWMLLTAFTQS